MLQDFITHGIFSFILVFVRIGTALTIMPGIGDSLTPQNVRLYIALGLSLVLSPLVSTHVPDPVPAAGMLFTLIVMEFIVGLFIGTVARVLMAALDTAGMLVSMASGLGNAQIFNPGFSSQGSLIGAFFSMTGATLLLVTNMHHMLFYGLVGSYEMFPVGSIPDTASMAQLIAQALSASFLIAFQIAAPFLVMSLLIYIGMGVLSRLMPQVQVFMLAVPIQILLSLLTISLITSGIMLFFLSKFEDGMIYFMSNGAGP